MVSRARELTREYNSGHQSPRCGIRKTRALHQNISSRYYSSQLWTCISATQHSALAWRQRALPYLPSYNPASRNSPTYSRSLNVLTPIFNSHCGIATFNDQNNQAGSCGQVHSLSLSFFSPIIMTLAGFDVISQDSSKIIALSNFWQDN